MYGLFAVVSQPVQQVVPLLRFVWIFFAAQRRLSLFETCSFVRNIPGPTLGVSLSSLSLQKRVCQARFL